MEHLTSKSDIYKSAHYLIHKNIIRGNTLTKRHPDTDELIMFNEWQSVPNAPSHVMKRPFAFAELFGESVTEAGVVEGQLDLFADFFEDEVLDEPESIDIKKVYQLG